MSDEKTILKMSPSVHKAVCRWIWPVAMVFAALGLLFSELPPAAKGLAVLSLAGWGVLGQRAGMLAPVLALLLIAMGRVGAFPGQTALFGAMVLGQAGLILRMTRPGPWEAVLAGLLWAGIAFCLPGLAPLAILGLLALASMQEEHGRALVFTGWGALSAGLVFVLVKDQVPASLTRPVEPETYEAIVALFRELFAVESLWTVIPLVGLLDFAQGYPQDGRRIRRNLPVMGGLFCLLFLPPETLRGALFTLGLPISGVLLSRWLLVLPPLRSLCSSRLKPTSNPLPDNVWLTSLTTLLAGVFLWGGWTTGRVLFLSGEPVTPVEARLLSGGGGHPLTLALMALSELTESAPLFWNRLVSGFFLVAAAGMLLRILNRTVGTPLALCAGILFLSVPGLAIRLSTAGGGAIGLCFFLKAFSSLSKENAQRSWLRGGMYAGVAFWMHPVWLFPCLGLIAGVWEVHRIRIWQMLSGFGIALCAGLAVMIAVQPAWLGSLIPAGMPAESRLEGVGALLWSRYLFLMGAWVLILALGATRRGTGWWCVCLSLIPFAFANSFGTDPAAGFIPLTVLSCMAFVRLPMMMDVRHPSSYQSVLTCQLLLWLPALLGLQEMVIFIRQGM
ncbi:MAG: hypothetical protein JJU05_13405 [Verrucomicrobia bacterium]|nr:hypothetical protein [Verrucomicrobiota bacterium]MCH8527433.1 hypothetical protein [Kiritimatiellia bacterium]